MAKNEKKKDVKKDVSKDEKKVIDTTKPGIVEINYGGAAVPEPK